MDISDATTGALKRTDEHQMAADGNNPPFSQRSAVAALYERRNINSESREKARAVGYRRYSDALRLNSKMTTGHSSVAGSIRWALEVRCRSRHPFRPLSDDPFLFRRRTSGKHARDYQSNHSGKDSRFFHGDERTNRRFGCNSRD